MSDALDEALRAEFDRALRTRRPFSVLALSRPDLPLGISPFLLEQASAAVRNATRTYDTAGVLGDHIIVAVLPETDATGAAAVALRLAEELAHRNGGRRVWRVMELPNAEQYPNVERLIGALLRVYAGSRAA